MEKETLDKIESLVNATDLNIRLNKDLGVFAVCSGNELRSTEQFQPLRKRFRGTFSTSSFSSFCRLLNDKKIGETFINHDDMAAIHIFNIGDESKPGHCDNKAELKLRTMAAFSSMRIAHCQKQTQLDFSEWLQEWQDNIVFYNEQMEPLDFNKTIAAVKSIDIKATKNIGSNVSSFGYEKSDFEKIHAESAHVLPSFFTFECVPYESLNIRVFTCRVNVITSEKPILFYRVQQMEKHREEMAEEFLNKIQAECKNNVVRIGAFSAK